MFQDVKNKLPPTRFRPGRGRSLSWEDATPAAPTPPRVKPQTAGRILAQIGALVNFEGPAPDGAG